MGNVRHRWSCSGALCAVFHHVGRRSQMPLVASYTVAHTIVALFGGSHHHALPSVITVHLGVVVHRPVCFGQANGVVQVRFQGRIHRNVDPVPSSLRVHIISARGLGTTSFVGPPSTFVTLVRDRFVAAPAAVVSRRVFRRYRPLFETRRSASPPARVACSLLLPAVHHALASRAFIPRQLM